MQQIDIPALTESFVKVMTVFDQSSEAAGQQPFRMLEEAARHLGH